MSHIEVNEAQFYYEMKGEGEPLILIAGYSCDHSFWEPIFEGLSKNYRVLIFDNRGVGQTVGSNVELSTDLLAEDVVALAKALQLKKPHVVGHSMGGTVAQSIASRFGSLIGKLVIINSTYKWRSPGLLALKSQLEMRKMGLSFDLIFQASIPWFFGEAFLSNEKRVAKLKKDVLEYPFPQSVEDQEKQYGILRRFKSVDQLDKVQNKTLVVSSKEDLLALSQEGKQLASKIPHAAFVELECGHSAILEISEKILNLLMDFL